MKFVLVLLALVASVHGVVREAVPVDQCGCGNCGGDRK